MRYLLFSLAVLLVGCSKDDQPAQVNIETANISLAKEIKDIEHRGYKVPEHIKSCHARNVKEYTDCEMSLMNFEFGLFSQRKS